MTPNNSSASPGGNTELPHDRDEKATPPVENEQHRANRAQIDQAHRDVESGMEDTERIGTPNDVPSSRRNDGKTG